MDERLQKLIAAAGVASRRHAEELITAGRVTVNGKVVKELGTKADPEKDHIKVNGKLINPQLQSREKIYVLLNKPKGYLSSVSDPEGRPLVPEESLQTDYFVVTPDSLKTMRIPVKTGRSFTMVSPASSSGVQAIPGSQQPASVKPSDAATADASAQVLER